MRRFHAVWAILIAAPWCATGHAAAGKIDWAALARLERCEQPAPRVVVYAGGSDKLGACLDGLKLDQIDELRITSFGGDGWETLELAQRIRGRLNLLTVDTMCAQSCAAYIIPVANRLRVLPHSYVFLGDALTLHSIDQMKEPLEKALRAHRPNASEAEIAQMKRLALDHLLKNLAEQLPVQAQFEQDALSCHDWLDVNGHRPPPPDGTRMFRVTREMAVRCLKTTQVTTFWSVPIASDTLPNIGIDRRPR